MKAVPKTTFFLYLCLFSVFCVLFSFSVTNSATRYILGAIGGSNDTASYTIAFYGMGNSLSIPLALGFCHRYGTKKFLLTCLYLFTIFTCLSAFSINYTQACLFRLLQGLTSGPIMIAIVNMLSRLSTDEEKDKFVRNIVIVFISGSIVGAAVGGTIAYFYSWHHIFYLNTTFLIGVTACMQFQLRGVSFATTNEPIDWIGYLFYFIGIGSLGTFIITGQEYDWFRSPLMTTLFITALITLPYFAIHTYKHPYPIINFHLMRYTCAAFALFQVIFLFSTYFGMTILIALWLNLYVNYDVNWVGLVLASTASTIFFVMLLLRKMKVQNGLPTLIASTLLLSLSCYMTMKYNAEVNFARILYARIIAGLGLGLFLPPLFNMMLCRLKDGEGIDMIVLFQVFRSFSSAMGAAIFTTIWQRRAVFYHQRLGGQLTEFSSSKYLSTANFFTDNPAQSLNYLSEGLERQSITLALDDTFYLMSMILFTLFILNIVYLTYCVCKDTDQTRKLVA